MLMFRCDSADSSEGTSASSVRVAPAEEGDGDHGRHYATPRQSEQCGCHLVCCLMDHSDQPGTEESSQISDRIDKSDATGSRRSRQVSSGEGPESRRGGNNSAGGQR